MQAQDKQTPLVGSGADFYAGFIGRLFIIGGVTNLSYSLFVIILGR